jgi:Tfp pilus assembly pilus retraction ATPase PilT
MITMDDSLKELYNAGLISQEETMARAEDKTLMRQHFES